VVAAVILTTESAELSFKSRKQMRTKEDFAGRELEVHLHSGRDLVTV
jgi:hypothetical protein